MKDEYAGLSPEEIDALKEDDGDNEPIDEDKVEDEKNDGDDDGKTESPKDEPTGDQSDGGVDDSANEKAEASQGVGAGSDTERTGKKDEGDGTTDGGEGTEADTGEDGNEEDTEHSLKEEAPFVPQLQSPDEKALEGLKNGFDEAKKQFDEGEIDFAKFSDAKDLYHEAKWKADFAQEANSNLVNERWKWEQERFLDENSVFRDNRSLNAAFVHNVNKIVAGAGGEKLSDRAVLLKARGIVEADMRLIHKDGDDSSSKVDVKEKAKTDAIKNAKKTKGDRSEIPVDLRSAPSAGDDNVDGEFAYLDKLSGEKFQSAIDKMSPTQLEKYENS